MNATYTTRINIAALPELIPDLQQLQLAIESNGKRYGEAYLKEEQAWQAWDAAVDSDDPEAYTLRELAEAFERERKDAYYELDSAKMQLLAVSQ